MRAFETEKTEVAEIDRSVYDIKDKVNAAFEVNSGLTAEIVEKISEEKHDPEWMREFRLKALETYNKMSIPNWGPSLEGLDMSNIVTYVRPNTESLSMRTTASVVTAITLVIIVDAIFAILTRSVGMPG